MRGNPYSIPHAKNIVYLTVTTFTPISLAAIGRIRDHVAALESATNPGGQHAALFLLHCECKDVADSLEPEQPTTEQPVTLNENE